MKRRGGQKSQNTKKNRKVHLVSWLLEVFWFQWKSWKMKVRAQSFNAFEFKDEIELLISLLLFIPGEILLHCRWNWINQIEKTIIYSTATYYFSTYIVHFVSSNKTTINQLLNHKLKTTILQGLLTYVHRTLIDFLTANLGHWFDQN